MAFPSVYFLSFYSYSVHLFEENKVRAQFCRYSQFGRKVHTKTIEADIILWTKQKKFSQNRKIENKTYPFYSFLGIFFLPEVDKGGPSGFAGIRVRYDSARCNISKNGEYLEEFSIIDRFIKACGRFPPHFRSLSLSPIYSYGGYSLQDFPREQLVRE